MPGAFDREQACIREALDPLLRTFNWNWVGGPVNYQNRSRVLGNRICPIPISKRFFQLSQSRFTSSGLLVVVITKIQVGSAERG